MNLEAIYRILCGASNSGSGGVKYDVIKRWFAECGIINERIVTEHLFTKSYERLCPNREDLTLTSFIQLIGILSRETRQDVTRLEAMFKTVQHVVYEEIQERIRQENETE